MLGFRHAEKERESDGSDSIRCGGAYELMKFSSIREHDERNLSITENCDFLCFLKNPISSFRVSNLSVGRVFNPLNLNLPTTHLYENTTDTRGYFRRIAKQNERAKGVWPWIG